MRRTLLAAFVVTLLYPGYAAADPVVLGTGQFGIGFGTGSPTVQPGPMQFSMTIMPDFGQPGPTLFDMSLVPSDAGSTFEANGGTDADFAEFAGFLTNGHDDEMEFLFAFADGDSLTASISESGVFSMNPGVTASMIKSIRMHVDELVITTVPGSTREVSATLSFSVLNTANQVPEPATLLLVASCTVALARRRHQEIH
jgi:hypothetical protein